MAAVGEMAAGEIPLGIPQHEYDALLEGNEGSPREVVVEVAPGESKRGWKYQASALKRIAGEVMRGGLPGYKGHQKPEDVATQFPDPVTHWVGALEQNGRFYFRGVIDRAAGELKGWLRAGRVTQVSIFGFPELKNVGGEIHVVDYEPISIDWTPLKRAGMPTSIVALGEMDAILAPGEKPLVSNKPEPTKGEEVETLQEWAKKGRELNITPEAALGEMGTFWKAEDVAKAANVEIRTDEDKAILTAVGEMATKLGIKEKDGKLDLEAMNTKIADLAKLDEDKRTATRDERIEKVVGEMVANDTGKTLVSNHKTIAALGEQATDDEIKKAVGEVLEDDAIKSALKGLGMTINVDPQNGTKATGEQQDPPGVTRETVSI